MYKIIPIIAVLRKGSAMIRAKNLYNGISQTHCY